MQHDPGFGPPFADQEETTNGLGTAGFIVSIIGFLSCGLLSPIGLLLSLPALFKPPRGMAIAGSVLGFVGTAWLVLFGYGIMVTATGFKNLVEEASREAEQRAAIQVEEETFESFAEPATDEIGEGFQDAPVDDPSEEGAGLGPFLTPDSPEGDAPSESDAGLTEEPSDEHEPESVPEEEASQEDESIPEDEPEPTAETYRTWTSSAGTTIEAEFVSLADGKVTLLKRDGKTIEVPLGKLSSEDQQFILDQSPFE